MKILEQYLKTVGSRLPWRNRKDITDELRSLMMDQIEERYGTRPTEEELKSFLTEYGSPEKTASSYIPERPLIAPGLADLFRLVILIMAGAMLIAFTVVGLIDILDGTYRDGRLVLRILKIPLEAFSAWLAGVGTVTLVFMGMSRFMNRPEIDLNEDWKVEDLKDVKVGKALESRLESIITIGALSLFIVLLNVYPGIITLAENAFAKSGLGPHHVLVVDQFRIYVVFLSLLWAVGIVTRVLMLRAGEKSRNVEITEVGLSLAEAVLDVVMLTDSSLFMSVGDGGWIGFRVIIAIALVANIGELIGGSYRLIRNRVSGE